MTDAATIEQDRNLDGLPREKLVALVDHLLSEVNSVREDYVTDAELIRRLRVPEKIARRTIKALDAQRGSGFPQKQKLWGDRRYWPAVRAYHERTNGLNIEPFQQRKVANAR